jgi:Family of unknown function (DUF6982)
VVARFIAGETIEGNLIRFEPGPGILQLRTGSGKRNLNCSELKALFFLRRPSASILPESYLKPGGKKVRVTFVDGEEITGYSYGLHPLQKGFYLYPINKDDRNERIYIFRKYAQRIQTRRK